MKNIQAYIEIRNLNLAAAIAAMGIPFVEDQPFVKIQEPSGKVVYKFFFNADQNSGYSIQELIGYWLDENFHINNPEHPFAYIKCAFMNRETLIDVVKNSGTIVTHEQDGRTIIIGKESTDDTKSKVFKLV